MQPQSTALEISFLLLEERQQLLENLIPMAVDFAVECVTKARRMGMDCFPVCRDFRRRSAKVYPAAQGFAVPFNGLRATNRQAGLRVASSWVAIALSSPLRKATIVAKKEPFRTTAMDGYSLCTAACVKRYLKLCVERPMMFCTRRTKNIR